MTLAGVSGDPLDIAEALARDQEYSFAVLSDHAREVMRAYGVEDPANETAWPAIFVIGPEGKVLKRLMLETYKERPLVDAILESLPAEGAPSP